MSDDVFIRYPRIARRSMWCSRAGSLTIAGAFMVAVIYSPAAAYVCPASLVIMLLLTLASKQMQASVAKKALETDRQACMGCGYDLRATIDTGQCPECGTYFNPQTLKDEWDAWLVPSQFDSAERAPHPPFAQKLRRWYWLGFLGIPIGIAYYMLFRMPGVVFSIILAAPLIAAAVSGLRFGALMERVEAAKFKVCTRCGYDLQASPPTGPCPECGTHYDIDTNVLLWKNWCMVRVKSRNR